MSLPERILSATSCWAPDLTHSRLCPITWMPSRPTTLRQTPTCSTTSLPWRPGPFRAVPTRQQGTSGLWIMKSKNYLPPLLPCLWFGPLYNHYSCQRENQQAVIIYQQLHSFLNEIKGIEEMFLNGWQHQSSPLFIISNISVIFFLFFFFKSKQYC